MPVDLGIELDDFRNASMPLSPKCVFTKLDNAK